MPQTGLRVNEVAELKISDVDLSERSGMVRVRSGKGRKARDVLLNIKGRRALKLYLKSRSTKLAPNDHVFLSEIDTPLSVRAIRAVVTELVKRANITRIKVSPHTFRHTFAINYLKHNPNQLVQLAKLLGHESLDTTAIYTQPSIEDLEINLERMAFG